MTPLFLQGKQGESGANSTTAGASEARSKNGVVPPQTKAFSSVTALVRWQRKIHPDLPPVRNRDSPSCTRGFILDP
ncbi:MAG: hypothetical protein E6L09_00955 [Verrucomicrobia bacterium]|nr:MAG: hypothetical protein E6L09_00955 [Verrucomicrobiota bacterium]